MEDHPAHTRAAEPIAGAEPGPELLSEHWRLVCKLLVSSGAVILAIGLAVAPERSWGNLLLAAFFLVSMGLFGPLFISIMYAANAGWHVGFRRIPEAMAALLKTGAAMIALTLAGSHLLYEWTHAEAVAEDALLQLKTGWLNMPFFLLRSALYLAIWIGLAHLLVRNSRAQDSEGGGAHTARNVKLGAVFIVVFGLTYSAASFDWVMSLEPHWFSTMFGVYAFSGMFVSGLAAMVLVLLGLKRMGMLSNEFTTDHLHDLGKLVFGFSSFWAYIWFCQYMLIWYSNIPEETSYFMSRTTGAWASLTVVSLALNWVIPFLILMPRAAKRSPYIMSRVCIVVLLGHWLDLYLMVMPAVKGGSAIPGLLELGGVLLIVPLFVLGLAAALRKAHLIPIRDPYLAESLGHHV